MSVFRRIRMNYEDCHKVWRRVNPLDFKRSRSESSGQTPFSLYFAVASMHMARKNKKTLEVNSRYAFWEVMWLWSEIQTAVSVVNDGLLRDLPEKTFSFHSSISEEEGLYGWVSWITLRIPFFNDQVKRSCFNHRCTWTSMVLTMVVRVLALSIII